MSETYEQFVVRMGPGLSRHQWEMTIGPDKSAVVKTIDDVIGAIALWMCIEEDARMLKESPK